MLFKFKKDCEENLTAGIGLSFTRFMVKRIRKGPVIKYRPLYIM